MSLNDIDHIQRRKNNLVTGLTMFTIARRAFLAELCIYKLSYFFSVLPAVYKSYTK